MGTITAKQLHLETREVLNQVERGETLLISRHGRVIGRLEPLAQASAPGWEEIMQPVWQAQKRVRSSERQPNPVLVDRQRRRR